MIVQQLNQVSFENIVAAFNTCFENYYVSVSLNRDKLLHKINAEDIDLKLSAGVFIKNELVAFILHGKREIDKNLVFYNAGTGVIPHYRGQKLIQKLYDFIIPVLRENKFSYGILEVISDNKRAIKSYQNIGFVECRTFSCFKGKVRAKSSNTVSVIKEVDGLNWSKLEQFWDWQPSWQYSVQSIENRTRELIKVIYQKQDKTIAYLVFDPVGNKVIQFAVSKTHRGLGIGKALFNYIAVNYRVELNLINIDSGATSTISFIKSLGLKQFIEQKEIKLEL